ncbi:ankyrin repeat-containing domain protein [Hypoxylon sp. FL1284]|nr:ankyrin repeat-containing domain protein [Hypoxylon sp. FL1284]
MHHLRLSGHLSELSSKRDVLRDFLSPISNFRDGWITIYNQLSPNPKRFNRRTTTPLHIICCFDIPLLGNEASDVSSQYYDVRDHAGRTPLSFACEMGHARICDILILGGADYRIRDEIYGQTALGWAIAEGHKEVVRLLLHHGADPTDHLSGTTPLHLAIQRLDSELVELLLENGADPKASDNYTGWSALSLASSLGDTYIMALLLKRGAEILGKGQGYGWTPLHHAVFKGRQLALKTLISSLNDSQIQRLRHHHVSGSFSWVDRVLGYSLCGVCCAGSGTPASSRSGVPSRMNSDPRKTESSGRKAGKGRSQQRRNSSLYNRNDDNGDEDDDDSQPRDNEPLEGTSGNPRFACPYEKVCPEENRCSPTRYPSMYRLRAHLLRKHEVSRCWSCYRHFGEEEQLRNHAPSCDRIKVPIQREKGFDGTQRFQIKATKPADFACETDHWRRIFRLCFPDWSPIPNPYHDDLRAKIQSEKTRTHIIEICRGEDPETALQQFLFSAG